MAPPPEFTPASLKANSTPDKVLPYAAHVRSGEPYKSLARRHFHNGAKGGLGVYSADMRALADSPAPGLDLNDPELFYNAGDRSYWDNKDLPKPTHDIARLRADMLEWGYCLVADALSPEQLEVVRNRVYAQADGERKAGLAYFGSGAVPPGQKVAPIQLVHSLLNKGDIFRRFLEFDPEIVQGGPVVEQLLSEILGEDFLVSTFLSLITDRYNMPQNMHQDQVSAPFQTPIGPMSCNTIFLLDAFTATNGGTLVIPGSHKIVSQGTSITKPLPPPVNIQGPAGTALMFEGRLVHGAGVNRTDKRRAALILDTRMHFMRQQELFVVSLAPDVIPKLSPKMLGRLGFRPRGMGGAEGTFTEFQYNHRMAVAEGKYKPIRELSPDSPLEVLMDDYTFRYTETGARQAPLQADAVPEVLEKFKGIKARVPTGDLGRIFGLIGEKL